MKNILFLGTAFVSLLQGVWAGAPGATNSVPGIVTNTPPTVIPGVVPGVTTTNAIPGDVPGMAQTNSVPGGTPGLTNTNNVPPTMIPSGVPGMAGTIPAIPGAPALNPGTGMPIGTPTTPGTTPVSTNSPPAQIQEIVTPQMIHEALRVFAQESRVIRIEAESGNIRQQHNLAVLYTLGLGVPIDFQRAFMWFNKAADEGLPEAQFNVAIALQNGMGTRKDLITSYKFYILASAQGLPAAAEARDHLAKYLNREQIETGQRMARGFMTNLERRRYFKRRKLFEQYMANLIRSGEDHSDPNNYSEYLLILFKNGTPMYDIYNKENFFPPLIQDSAYQQIPPPQAFVAPNNINTESEN